MYYPPHVRPPSHHDKSRSKSYIPPHHSRREDSPEPYYLDKFGNLMPSGRHVYDNMPAAGAHNSKSPSSHDDRAGIPPSLLRRNLHSSLSNILAYEEAVPANSMQTSLNNTQRNRKEFGSPHRDHPAGRRSGQSTERYSQPIGPKSGYIRTKWEKIGYENNQEMSSITKTSPERKRYLDQETFETEEQQRDSLEDLEDGYYKRQKKRRNSQEKYGSPIKKKIDQERIMTKDKQAASFQGRIKKAGELMKATRTYGEIHKGRRPSGPVSPTKPAKPSQENPKRSKGSKGSSKSISQRSEEGGFSHRLLTKEMLKSAKLELTDETELSDTVENFVVGYEPKRKSKTENRVSMSRKASRGVIEERVVTKVGQEISTKSTQRDDIDSLNSRIDRIKREIIEDITRKTQESISSHSSDRVKSRTEIADSEPSRGLRRDSLEEGPNFKGNSPIQELSKRYGEPTGVPRPRPEPKISMGSKEMEAVKTSPVAWFGVEEQEGQERKRTSAWNDDSRRSFEPVSMGKDTEESEFPGLIEDSRWPTNYSMGINGNEMRLLEQNEEFSFEKSQQKNEKSLDYSKESQEEIIVKEEVQGKFVKQQAPNFSQIESLFKANPVQQTPAQPNNTLYDSKAYSSPTKNRPFMGFIKAPPKYSAQQGSPSKSIDYFFRAYNQQSAEPLKEVSIPYSFGGIQPQPVVVDKSFAREMEYSSRKINHYEVKVIYNDDKKDLMLMNFLNGNLLTSQLQESPNKKVRRRVF